MLLTGILTNLLHFIPSKKTITLPAFLVTFIHAG